MVNKSGRSVALKMLALVSVLAGVVSVTSCSEDGASIKPKILMFNYSVQTVADPGAVATALRDGENEVGEHISADPCNFTADFTTAVGVSGDARIPDFRMSGVPGQEGANLSISASGPGNLATTNSPACGTVDAFAISIGSSSTTINLGESINAAGAEVTIGGVTFDTGNGFFSATLNSFDRSSGYKTGEFEFMARASNDASVFVVGTFASR